MTTTPKFTRSLMDTLNARKMPVITTTTVPLRYGKAPPLPGPKATTLIPDEPVPVTPLTTDRPETPGPLRQPGLDLWIKICKILFQRGTLCEDFLQPLYTLCTLHDLATDLREEYIGCLTVSSSGNGFSGGTKINPAVIEWTKAVALLRAYYADFELTPVAARKSASPTSTGNKTKTTVTNRRKIKSTSPVASDGIFDPL